jgi:cell division protease FtsH
MRNLVWVFVILGLILAINFSFNGGMVGGKTQDLSYSRLLDRIKHGDVADASVGKTTVTGSLKSNGRYQTDIPDGEEFRNELAKALVDNKVSTKRSNPVISENVSNVLFSILLPLALMVGIWVFFFKQAQAGGNQALTFGRSRAKRVSENVPKITFEDVQGVDEAKQELQEVVEFLRSPKKFQALGAKIPKGVLLLGPPGCGKTMLAKAVAGEAGVPFFHISGSDFVEMFVGVGASRVRDLFDQAKANRPALVFIDEIDAVGRQRGAGLGGGHDEREQTLNQLLVEMDGFDANTGVILIAATNRPDVLDPALLRPGRFDRRVTVDAPDANGRKAILKVHAKDKPLAQDVNLESLARRTPGFTGADLANLVNEAALLAARRDQLVINMNEFEASIDRVIAGPERKSKIINDKEKEMVAYHEVGHAIVLELLPHADPVHKVTILPRGMALGYTMQLPTEDRYLVTRSELLDDIAGLLGGRSAEEMIFQEMTTGANNDLERATAMARAMVCEFGMSEKLGPLTLGHRQQNPFLGRDYMDERNYSEEVAQSIDAEIRSIIEKGYARATEILQENREKMDVVVKALIERETLERDEFLKLMNGEELAPFSKTPPEGGSAVSSEDKAGQEKRQRSGEMVPKFRPEPA